MNGIGVPPLKIMMARTNVPYKSARVGAGQWIANVSSRVFRCRMSMANEKIAATTSTATALPSSGPGRQVRIPFR